ncbi:hypothetical protein HHI36_023737 [Cryptolaemus montrouzieri]|uniref:Uncharacterized protein n=1 Tax=Cryptolaemus montrouzieri TaxID=559131 RepID=A0ABD2PIQ3_9CUCU
MQDDFGKQCSIYPQRSSYNTDLLFRAQRFSGLHFSHIGKEEGWSINVLQLQCTPSVLRDENGQNPYTSVTSAEFGTLSSINNVCAVRQTRDTEQEMPTGEENVDELRQRLNIMKKMMAERQYLDDSTEQRKNVGVIDGSFLSMVFGTALIVIIIVSIYAFYNLYIAILKKFPSKHEEL